MVGRTLPIKTNSSTWAAQLSWVKRRFLWKKLGMGRKLGTYYNSVNIAKVAVIEIEKV